MSNEANAPVETLTATITGRGTDSTVPDNPDAVDADIYRGGELLGSVTLLPAEDGRDRLETWGPSADLWADQGILDAMEADEDRRALVGEIVEAVNEAHRRG